MATYNLIKKTDASTGQRSTPLGTNSDMRVENLENKIEEQTSKLNKIDLMLHEISKKISTS